MNEIKEPKETQESTSQGGSSFVRAFERSLSMNKANATRALPFIMFITLLAVLYIANSHNAEKTIRKSNRIGKEIKELRSEYITIKSDLMFRSKQSEVAKRLEERGIVELRNPPKKIVIEPSEY